jgi:DHA2 family multidrug resistance protein
MSTAVLPAAGVAAPATSANKWLIATAVALGALLEIIDTSIVNVALTEMQNALGATLSQVSWVVSSYAVANVIILPLTAWLGHRFGKKRYFVFSLVGFTLASMLCGMATTLPMLIVARVLQGLTGGGLLAKAQAFLFETFPREEQAMAQAFFSAIVIAGPAIGPTLGGYIVTNIGWRWIFFINLPVGLLAVMMVQAFVPKDVVAKAKTSVDWLAIALLAIGIGSLQTFLEEGNADDWFESSFITALAVVAAVGLVAFVWRVLRSKEPVVDLRVLRYRSLWAGCVLGVVVGMALYGALFAVPIFAQTMLHYTSQQTGFLMLPGALASAVAMPIAGKVLAKVDPRVAVIGGALILVTAIHMLTSLSPLTSGDDFFWPLIVRSFGTAFMFLPLSMASIGPIPKKDVSSATGLYNLMRQLGGSIGVALLTTMLSQRQAFHRTVLVEKMASNDPLVLARLDTYAGAFLAKGFDLSAARQKALMLLDGIVNQQAAVMSFADTFWATAALILVSLPLVLLLGKPERGAKVEAGH